MVCLHQQHTAKSDAKNWTTAELLNNFKEYHDPIPTILSETKDTELIWNDIIDIAPLQQLAFDNILCSEMLVTPLPPI
ncbi:hypothetical protein KUH03_23555 [Sphingobacterium sp. E70]|uniref:hypothetical protein n=1 Tax=Sphingobacterium sp. E70 TaxID=2853439 RepID=UPI00211B92A9|nr:hypothetical protein [Sphingobacterium sp. E70]ULT22398.1 hypothetical protein KUH03_23555 [Sphingobacterium sp. E70]